MGFTSFEGLLGGWAGRGAGHRVVTWGLASVIALGAVGCGGQEQPTEEPRLSTQAQAIQEDNGLSLNGLSLNGLSLNGLSLNGLSLNGLHTGDFLTWFDGNPEGHSALMGYMVRCAVPAGESRTFTHPSTGRQYTWSGALGLAPNWAGGAPATVEEQQVITSCLGAHANNYGVHVTMSVLGRGADGMPIPFSAGELSTYSRREACFFGNVFTSEGLFAGNDRGDLGTHERSARPCGLTKAGVTSNETCPQVQRIGRCEEHCSLEPNGNYYTQCSLGGSAYKVLTTRMRPLDFQACASGNCP